MHECFKLFFKDSILFQANFLFNLFPILFKLILCLHLTFKLILPNYLEINFLI
jgi:hypothetical protein